MLPRSLFLKTAVTGTRVEDLVEIGGTCEDIYWRILMVYGRTAEWTDLSSIDIKQAEEPLRQFCLCHGSTAS